MKDDLEMELYERELECERLRAEIFELKHELTFFRQQADHYREEAAEYFGEWQATKRELEELESACDNINLTGGIY